MRCNNCGWDNPEGQEKCIKCNSILTVSNDKSKASNSSTEEKAGLSGTVKGGQSGAPAWDKQNISGTVKGGQSDLTPWDKQGNVENPQETHKETAIVNCTNCGYPVSHGATKCPKCGAIVIYEKEMPQKTINPYSKAKTPVCYLSLLPRENEKDTKNIEMEGQVIDLTRTNVEPENESVSRGIHARLEFKDGHWYLSNPENKVTFIKVDKPVKLEPGDVILLGDRMIRFEK